MRREFNGANAFLPQYYKQEFSYQADLAQPILAMLANSPNPFPFGELTYAVVRQPILYVACESIEL